MPGHPHRYDGVACPSTTPAQCGPASASVDAVSTSVRTAVIASPSEDSAVHITLTRDADDDRSFHVDATLHNGRDEDSASARRVTAARNATCSLKPRPLGAFLPSLALYENPEEMIVCNVGNNDSHFFFSNLFDDSQDALEVFYETTDAQLKASLVKRGIPFTALL